MVLAWSFKAIRASAQAISAHRVCDELKTPYHSSLFALIGTIFSFVPLSLFKDVGNRATESTSSWSTRSKERAAIQMVCGIGVSYVYFQEHFCVFCPSLANHSERGSVRVEAAKQFRRTSALGSMTSSARQCLWAQGRSA